MNKKLALSAILFTALCLPAEISMKVGSLSTAAYAMGTAPPTQEVEIIERIVTQTEEVKPKEEYEMKVLMEIPWGSRPGELGTKVVEGYAVVPDRLAVDSSGNIYIFDKANNRINKYNKFGGFIRDYEVDSFRKLPPEGGSPNPVLVQNDIDMGVDAAGNVYVLNSRDAIRKLNPKSEVVDRLPVPAGANYIRVEQDGRVEAIRYNNDGQIEMFDVSTKQVKVVKGFKTPGGLNIVFGEDKGVNEPKIIRIFDKDGNLIKELEIEIPYELYRVDFLGTNENGEIFITVERQSDETKLKEVEPGEFRTIRLLGWYVRKYDRTGSNLLAEEKYILNSSLINGGVTITGDSKCFSIDKQGNIYLMVMFGKPHGRMRGFTVFKWETKQ